MKQKYIPIIGQMSAGKSNFLNAFLGLEVLQTGSTTTTKFICLIKNSNSTSFYQVLPIKENDYLSFDKKGREIRNLEEIKEKIKNINIELDNKKGDINDIFYCLETPIKNNLVRELLGKYTFMDIPGLNEDESNYCDEIFSLLTLKDIFFEIIIFNSEESYGGVTMNKILKKLKEKNCLKLTKNLYILNKIDKRSDQDKAITNFNKFFYDNFQDQRKHINVEINLYENEFVPLSSLLYQAEMKYKEDFYYFLLLLLFQYIKEKKKSQSFIDFLYEKIKIIIKQNNIDESIFEDIEDENESLDINDIKIINESLERLKKIISQLRQDNDFSLGIYNEIDEEIKKSYLIYKKKLYKNYCYSKNYKALESAIKNIVTNIDDSGCAPGKINETKNEDILNDMINFFKEKLNNQIEENRAELKVIRDNLNGNKIRIAFIGNISVGKSTLLNCIIGEDILPTNEDDCTFRAIIVKHKNINEYYLYNTEIIEFGRGSKEYISFVEKDRYYCKGIRNIKSYLTTKNSDKDMGNNDTALILQGRLKIFDFIKFDDKLIEIIEFIDLPGLNRVDKGKLKNDFYHKILEYSNSCLYINSPTIKDSTNVENIQKQYEDDKKYISIKIRDKYLSTCLFVINKADQIQEESEKRKIEKDLKEIMKKTEKEENVEKNLKICFFSGLFFFRYLGYYKFYVDMLEKNPFSVLYYLYEEHFEAGSEQTFNKFVIKEINTLIKKLTTSLNNNIPVPNDFTQKMKHGFNQLSQAVEIKFSKKEEEEIIKNLYNLNHIIKNHNFTNTNYSIVFFEKLREVINRAYYLQKINLKCMIEDFFREVDIFFTKESTLANEKQKESDKKKYDIFQDKIIPKIDNLLNRKSENLKNIILKTKEECLDIIDDEIKNASPRLKSADNDLRKAASNLEAKMRKKIEEMKINCENEVKTIGEEIKKESEEEIETQFKSQNLSFSQVEINKFKNVVISVSSGALGGVISGLGLYAGGAAIAGGVAAGTISLTSLTSFIGTFFGPIGIVGGFAIGGVVSALVVFFRKSGKYKDSLEASKPKVIDSFIQNEKCILNDFGKFRTDLNIEIRKKVELFYKNIEFSDEEWAKIRQEYRLLRQKTSNKLKEKFGIINNN